MIGFVVQLHAAADSAQNVTLKLKATQYNTGSHHSPTSLSQVELQSLISTAGGRQHSFIPVSTSKPGGCREFGSETFALKNKF